MGPTNVALVKLFQADQKLREAQARLDAAGKNVRLQERRVSDLNEKLKAGQTKLREQQATAAQLELDVKSRDARIERLRSQQQAAKNNKEYQAFLIEINTEKVDRGKAEDELIKVMEIVEKAQAEVKEISGMADVEQAKLTAIKEQLGQTLAQLQSEVDAMRPAREAAGAAVPANVRDLFERLSDRYEGEALSPLEKPDRRREEYACGACNMDLVTNVYNKLHSRDELVFCPSCGRILFIPEDLPPEAAINSRGKYSDADGESGGGGGTSATPKPKSPRTRKTVEKLGAAERRPKGKIGQLLSGAQGESVKTAVDAGLAPIECEVFIDGKLMGLYKGRTREHLERVIQVRMDEGKLVGNVEVKERATPGAPASEQPAATEAPAEPPSHAVPDASTDATSEAVGSEQSQ